jgi:hypothetical protein
LGRHVADRTKSTRKKNEEEIAMSNIKLLGRFLGFLLELGFICLLIWGGVMLAWWVAG